MFLDILSIGVLSVMIIGAVISIWNAWFAR